MNAEHGYGVGGVFLSLFQRAKLAVERLLVSLTASLHASCTHHALPVRSHVVAGRTLLSFNFERSSRGKRKSALLRFVSRPQAEQLPQSHSSTLGPRQGKFASLRLICVEHTTAEHKDQKPQDK